jgi:hypothetical protein
MSKPPLCQWPDGCNKETVFFPRSTIRKKYCEDHAIAAVLIASRKEVEKDKADLERVRQESKKRLSVNQFYKTRAWLNFSHYVLLYYANDDLEVVCSTNPRLWYRINDPNICVGHYLKVFDANSTNFSTAFEFRNVGPQSRKENDRGGNMEAMAHWIEDTHGVGTVEELKQIRRKPLKLDKYTLDQIAKTYLALFNEELKRRGIKDPWK